MPFRELGFFVCLSLIWVMFAMSNNEHGNDLFWGLNYITIKSLAYWWGLLILKLFPEFSLQIRSLRSQLIGCHCWLRGCCCFEKADPVGILNSILFLSPQVSSSLSCELSPPLPNLFTFSSDSVSRLEYNDFSCVLMHLWVCMLGKRGIGLEGSDWPFFDKQNLVSP